jgi:peptidoglycan hydrolase-like protein with peptidoglycan-binding domain
MLLAMSERWSNPTMNPQGVDGIVGPRTRAALRSWQAAADLPQDGVADFNTIQNLGSNWIKFGAPLNSLPANPADSKAFAVLNDLRARANVPVV